jgi:hypothetical protein
MREATSTTPRRGDIAMSLPEWRFVARQLLLELAISLSQNPKEPAVKRVANMIGAHLGRDVSSATVENWLFEETEPTVQFHQAIARTLGLTPPELWQRVDTA